MTPKAILVSTVLCAALTTTPSLAQSVGVTAAVNPAATGTAPGQSTRTMVVGEKVIHNEKIDTSSNGLVQILLADGTSFTVGPNSSMTIDSFVYDPNAGTAKVTATLGKGFFRFIGGRTSKTDGGVALNTPVGTAGIRGGIADLSIGDATTGSHIDLRYGSGVTLSHNGKVIGFVFKNGYSIVIGPNGGASVKRTPADWTTAFQQKISGKASHNGGSVRGSTSDVKVASNFDSSNSSSGVAGARLTGPAPKILPNADPSGLHVASWDEIQNSSLAAVNAYYIGEATGTVTSGGSQYTANGGMEMLYDFGLHNGSIDILLDGQLLYADVTPDAVSGPATFAGGLSAFAIDGSVSGFFTNNGTDVASGVQGTFDAHSTSGFDWSATGAFTGVRGTPGG